MVGRYTADVPGGQVAAGDAINDTAFFLARHLAVRRRCPAFRVSSRWSLRRDTLPWRLIASADAMLTIRWHVALNGHEVQGEESASCAAVSPKQAGTNAICGTATFGASISNSLSHSARSSVMTRHLWSFGASLIAMRSGRWRFSMHGPLSRNAQGLVEAAR